MAVRVKAAESTAELDAIFQLRHRVFAENTQVRDRLTPEGLAKLTAGFLDRWDAFPTTTHFCVSVGGQLVGTLRCAAPSAVGLPHDDYYDYRDYLPSDARPCSVGLLCIERDYRWMPQVAFSLMAIVLLWTELHGFTHVVSVAEPKVLSFFLSHAFKQVAPSMLQEETGLRVIPVICPIDEFKRIEPYGAFAGRHRDAWLLPSFERQLHEANETIFTRGERADEMFMIVAGHATLDFGGNGPTSTYELGPGDVFGEGVLLPSAQRQSTVRARTDLELAVIKPRTLEERMVSEPALVRQLMAALARRSSLAVSS